MEFRVLQYFLAVAREQSITKAAEYLHLSQPTLSRQLKDLERELGKQLFVRGPRKIVLTEEGMLLRRRAEEIVDLMDKTENEIKNNQDEIEGDVFIGGGETIAIEWIGKAGRMLQEKYPKIQLHISSGDMQDLNEQLDQGRIDFGILFDPFDLSNYNYLTFPTKDEWGVLMSKDAPLTQYERIKPSDLWDLPLIISRQQKEGSDLSIWMQKSWSELNISATYSLLYNASLLVKEGMGYGLALDRIVQSEDLCFRRLDPALKVGIHIVWKKYQLLNKASRLFLEELQACLEQAK